MSVRHVIKAIKIKMMLNRLSKAKENAMREFLGLPPKLSWFEQCYTSCMTAIKDKFCQTFCPCCVYDISRKKKRPGCWDSRFLKELLGFFGGAFLSIVLYLLLVYQIDLSPSTAFRLSAVTGLLLSLFMAFSVNMRCFVLLMIPQLFSGKGRMFLLMYALFLVMNHPMKNFNANILVMSNSATCGQEMALNKTKELAAAVAAPMQREPTSEDAAGDAASVHADKELKDAHCSYCSLAFNGPNEAIVHCVDVHQTENISSVRSQFLHDGTMKCKRHTFNVKGQNIMGNKSEIVFNSKTGKLQVPTKLKETESPVRKQLKVNTPTKSVHRQLYSESDSDSREMLDDLSELLEDTLIYDRSDDSDGNDPMLEDAYIGIMKSVKKVLQKVSVFGKSLKSVYVKCKKVVTEIGSVLKRVADWLSGIVDRCNEKMGAPYKKCIAAFNYAEGECKKAIFHPLSEGCTVVKWASEICVVARIGELLCLITKAIQRVIESEFELPVTSVLDDAAKMFDFTVDISYDFNFTVVQSKSYRQIKRDIQREISSRLNILVSFIRITELVMMLAILFIVVKALVYRTRYLCDDRYDNVYITYAVRDLDEKRKENGKEGILPLNSDECGKYVQSNSAAMISSEKRKLVLGLFFFFISLFNAGFYLLCDVGLFYVLYIVAKHFGADTGDLPTPPHTKLHVSGNGPMANIYKAIVSMFDPIAEAGVKINVGKCTPIPREPNWAMYEQIGIIYLLCLLLTILESYGLRLRHLIMGCYFPKREKQRAAWLYNHIVKCRGGIIQTARKRMRGIKFGDVAVQHISWRGQMAASFPILERLFKWCGWEVKSCLYCGREGKPDDYMNFIHCAFYDCDAIYCIDCFADLKNICAVCSNPVEPKGSDDTDEQDSSLDEIEKQKLQMQREYRAGRVQAIQDARRPSKILFGFKQMVATPDKDTNEDDTTVTETSENKPSEESLDESSGGEDMDKERQFSKSKDHNENRRILRSRPRTRRILRNTGLSPDSELSGDYRYRQSHNYHGIDIFQSDYNVNQHYPNDYCVDSDESSDSAVSSHSSVDSEELDNSYQYNKTIYKVQRRHFLAGVTDIQIFGDENSNAIQRKRKFKRDELVTRDMLTDSDTDVEFSGEDNEGGQSEPEEICLHRT